MHELRIQAGHTHPTGMLSCFTKNSLLFPRIYQWLYNASTRILFVLVLFLAFYLRQLYCYYLIFDRYDIPDINIYDSDA